MIPLTKEALAIRTDGIITYFKGIGSKLTKGLTLGILIVKA